VTLWHPRRAEVPHLPGSLTGPEIQTHDLQHGRSACSFLTHDADGAGQGNDHL